MTNSKPKLPQLLITLSVTALLLAACSSPDTAGPPGDDDVDDATGKGALAILVSGLPDGADADIDVTGPSDYAGAVTGTTTLEELEPGTYQVAAADVAVGSELFLATVNGAPAEVTEGGSASVTVMYLVEEATEDGATAEEDFDSPIRPAVHAQFRSVAGQPVWVDAPLFNEDAPIDTLGLQYRHDLSEPGDANDTVEFDLVHGDGPTTNIDISLACAPEPEAASPIRAVLSVKGGGPVVGGTIVCGDDKTFALENEGGSGSYLLVVEPIFDDPYYSAYVLSIDAYCFRECAYQPYSGD